MNIDAIILAGTKNYDKFRIGKEKEYKQYLKLNEKCIVAYVIDAALKAKQLKHIFIVGDPKKLGIVLKQYTPDQQQRITVVEHKNTLMDNIVHCFKQTEKAILLPSDAPFLQAKNIDHFLQQVREETDYAIGFTDGRGLDKIFDTLALFIKKERIKYGLFPIHDAEVRISNLHVLDYGKIRNAEHVLVQDIFNNRKLLDHKGRKNRTHWRNIGKSLLTHLHNCHYHPFIIVGCLMAAIYALFFYCAHKSRHSRARIVYTFFLRPFIIEKIIWLLTAGRYSVQVIITKELGPMLDIDLEENYHFLAKDNCRNFRDIQKYVEN